MAAAGKLPVKPSTSETTQAKSRVGGGTTPKSSSKPAEQKTKSSNPPPSRQAQNGVIAQQRKPTATSSNQKEKEKEKEGPKKTSKAGKSPIKPMPTVTAVTQDITQEEALTKRKLSVNSLTDVAPTLPTLEALSDRQNWQSSVRQGVVQVPQILLTTSERKRRRKIFKVVWAELEKEEWYHGVIPLEDVKSILHENGDFLVRKLDDDMKSTPPVVTVMWNTTLYHLPLYGVLKGKNPAEFTLNTHDHSSSYTNLIRMHWTQKIPVFKDIILIKAVPRQAWELTRDTVSMDEKIGEGAFGEVWKGKLKTKKDDKVETITVAVKIMKVNANTQAQLNMLHKEARLMRVYNHKNVVKLHGLVFDARDVMVVMELVSGGALNLYLKKNKVMPLVKASFCYDIAAGLAYLHSKNCMHRDVAARNCLVVSDGTMIKLSDFGLAAHGRRITLTSTDKVPVRWQAPEVLFHHVYMRESDVWSYGMLMSEIYNDGKPPFHDKTNAEIRIKIHDPKFRPLIPNLPLYPDIPQSTKFVSRTFQKKSRASTIKNIPGSSHTALSLDSKSLSIEDQKPDISAALQPTMVDETEAAKVQSNHLSPYIPPTNPPKQSKSDGGLLTSQTSNVIAQSKNSQKRNQAKSPSKALK